MLDHMLAHPWETGIAVFQIVGGSLGVFAVFAPGFSISVSLDVMIPWLAAALCVMLTLGGVFTLLGIYDEHEDLMIGYRRERAGLILSATAWSVYFVVVAAAFPRSILGWAFGLVLATCGAFRTWATYREEWRLREAPPDDA
jgi:hypothetical protein